MANMFDEARSISGMIKMRGFTQVEIADMLGVSQSYIGNKLRLLGLSEESQRLICEGGLSERHARLILKLRDEDARLYAIREVTRRRLTVLQTEALVDMMTDEAMPKIIPELDKSKRLLTFEESIDGSVNALRSLGVNITKRRRYDSGHTYITLCIKD